MRTNAYFKSHATKVFLMMIVLLTTGQVRAQDWIDDGTTTKTRDNILLEQPNTSANGNLLFKMFNGGGNRTQYIQWDENSSNMLNAGNYWFRMQYEGSNCTNCGDSFKFVSEQAGDIMTINPIDGNVTFHHDVNISGVSGLWSENTGNIFFNTGNVGIGVSNPAHKLDVAGTVQATQFIGDGSQLTGINAGLWTDNAGAIHYTGGNVGIGVNNPIHKLDVAGTVQATQFIGDGSQLTGVSVSGSDIEGRILAQHGGIGTGIALSRNNDYWGIYVSMSGVGRAFDGGEAVAGHDFSGDAVRFRSARGIQKGFIWENRVNRRLMSLNAGTGSLDVDGSVTATQFIGDGSQLTGINTGLWTDNAGAIHYTGGNVGIGVSNPAHKLDVAGTVQATQFIGDGSQLTGINTGLWTDNAGAIHYTGGNVGIGISNPIHKLDVAGTVQATQFIGDGSQLTGINTGLWTDNAGAIHYTGGNVGIGVSNPAHKLDVAGTVQATQFIGDGSQLTGLSVSGSDIEGRIVVQEGQDGGTGKGIALWNGHNNDWGIYMSQPGSGKAFDGGEAVAGHDFSGHAVRFRSASGLQMGFIWENSADRRLMSLNAGTGSLDVDGSVTATQFIGDGSQLTGINAGLWTDNAGAIHYTGGNVGIGVSNPIHKLDVAGTVQATQFIGDGSQLTGVSVSGSDIEGRIVVQEGQDGGTGKGIALWNGHNNDWGIYMSQSGSGKAFNGGEAVAGHDFSGYAVRFRSATSAQQGFIWENKHNQRLMSLNAGTGSLDVDGSVTATQFIGDGSQLTGLPGYSPALIDPDFIPGTAPTYESGFSVGALRVEARLGEEFHESGILLEVPDGSYNNIKGYNGDQRLGAIRFFDDTWLGGSFFDKSAGALNIDGMNGVTVGTWDDPIAVFDDPNDFILFNADLKMTGNLTSEGNATANSVTTETAFTLRNSSGDLEWSINPDGSNNDLLIHNFLTGKIFRFTRDGDLQLPGSAIAVDYNQHSGDLDVNGKLSVNFVTGYPFLEVDPDAFGGLGLMYVDGKLEAKKIWAEEELQVPNVVTDTISATHLDLNSNPGGYAMIAAGAVHIGPHSDQHSFSSTASLEDVYLFVEEGIATEDMTYIFKEDWDEWPDYVFEEDYDLSDLDELEGYIREHKHLPGVVSQAEVKQRGVSDKKMNITLLKKIEELTLYTIEQDNALEVQKALNTTLLERLEALEARVNELSNN